jgi:hypothetical protein
MKYAYLENDTVVDLVENDPFQLFQEAYASMFIEVPEEIKIGWSFDSEEWNAPLPRLKTQAELESEVQRQLNAFAQEKDFDSIEEAVSFVVSTDATWKAEAQFAISMRDKVWKTFYETGEVIPMVWPDEI